MGAAAAESTKRAASRSASQRAASNAAHAESALALEGEAQLPGCGRSLRSSLLCLTRANLCSLVIVATSHSASLLHAKKAMVAFKGRWIARRQA